MFKTKLHHPVLAIYALLFAALPLCMLIVGLIGPYNKVEAVANSTINFQARLLTASGGVVPDGNYNIEFKLYNAASSSGSSQGSCSGDAACVWKETRITSDKVRVVNGYLTVNLGSVETFSSSINWDQEHWLTMNIGGTGSPGWDGEMTPRLKLTAVPYAFRAGQLAHTNGANLSTLGWATQTSSNSILLPNEGGTLCIQNSTNCGFLTTSTGNSNYVQLQGSTPGTPQTGNLNISGRAIAGTALQSPITYTNTIDSIAAAGTVSIGTTNATGGINLNQDTTLASGKLLTVQGAALFKNSSNSATALEVRDQSNNTVFDVDTGNGRVGIGTNAPSRTFHTAINNAQTTAPMALLEQAGSGDASLEFKLPGKSFIVGQDASDSGKFKITSSTASQGTATLGRTDVGAADTGDGNTKLATKFTAGASGTVTSMSVYVNALDASTFNRSFSMAIYTDPGATGKPTTLLASAGTATAVVGWNTLSLSASITSGTTYWLTYWSNGDNNINYFTGGSSTLCAQNSAFTTWPSTYGASSCNGSIVSIYATYTPAGAYDSFNTALFTLGDTGQAVFQNSTNSTTALQVQNAAGNSILSVDTSNAGVILGKASTVNGKMTFQNSTNANLVNIQSGVTSSGYTLTLPTALGSSGNCLVDTNGSGALGFSSCASTVSLQNAYDSGNTITTTSGRNVAITLADTATDSNFTVNMQCTTCSASGGRFEVQNAGTAAFWLNPGSAAGQRGTVVFRNTTNDVDAFQIQTAGGGSTLFHVDTQNQRVGIGGAAVSSKFEVTGGDVAVYNSGNNPRLVLGDSTTAGQNGYLQWDSTNDYFRIETTGTSGLKVNNNFVSIGDIFPNQPLIVGNGSVSLFEIGTTGNITLGNSANKTLSIAQAGAGDHGNTFTVQAGSGNGTNRSGGDLVLQGGSSTGSGTPGAIIVKPQTNRAAAFQVQNAAGSSVILGVDTTNLRVGIGTASAAPSYALDVTGDINASTTLKVAGTTVCDTVGGTGCVAKTGTGFYIHNQTTVQAANLYVQAATTGTVAAKLQAFNGGSGNIAEFLNGTGTAVGTISSVGAVLIKPSTNSATAFQVQPSGLTTPVFNVDTGNSRVGIGTAAPSTTFNIAINNTQVTVPMAILEQAGTGDAAIQFKNATNSFYAGIDTSNSDSFSINSSTAAAAVSPATIAHVQSRISTFDSSGSTTTALAFTSNNAAGNLIVAATTWDMSASSTMSCSDTRGNAYATAIIAIDAPRTQALGICYAANSSAGANTVTATYGASSTFRQMTIHEYSGVATTNPLDVNTSNVAVGTSATDGYTSGTATTSADGDLIYGAMFKTSGAGTTFTAGTGYTQRINNVDFVTEDRTQTTAGSTAATFTAPLGFSYIAHMLAFKASVSGGSVTDTNANSLFTMSQSGAANFKNYTNSGSAFRIQNASGTTVFNADTANSAIVIGGGFSTSDTNLTTLNLDSTVTFADSATCSSSVNGGAMYYNSAQASSSQGGSSAIRACINGAWEDMASVGDLGLALFGVVPDSGPTIGDQIGTSGLTNSPCKVTWASTTSVNVANCVAYSGGRKVVISGVSTLTGFSGTSLTYHICLSGTNGLPTRSTGGTETANLPTFSANAPILCIADVKTGAGNTITNIYDTRTFTTSVKHFVTINSATAPGMMVRYNTAGTAGTVETTTTGDATTVAGVIAASSGSASTNTVNGIMVTSGLGFVKATASSFGTQAATSTTAGYAANSSSNAVNSMLGPKLRALDAACNAATNCQYAVPVQINPH